MFADQNEFKSWMIEEKKIKLVVFQKNKDFKCAVSYRTLCILFGEDNYILKNLLSTQKSRYKSAVYGPAKKKDEEENCISFSKSEINNLVSEFCKQNDMKSSEAYKFGLASRTSSVKYFLLSSSLLASFLKHYKPLFSLDFEEPFFLSDGNLSELILYWRTLGKSFWEKIYKSNPVNEIFIECVGTRKIVSTTLFYSCEIELIEEQDGSFSLRRSKLISKEDSQPRILLDLSFNFRKRKRDEEV